MQRVFFALLPPAESQGFSEPESERPPARRRAAPVTMREDHRQGKSTWQTRRLRVAEPEMRERARKLEVDIQRRVDTDELGKLFTAIQGVNTLTAAAIIEETGDPARFPNAAAFARYVGVVPRLRQSGKRKYSANAAIPLGNARLRRALWMPVLVAIRVNQWLAFLSASSRIRKATKSRDDRPHAQAAWSGLQHR
jgi:transposase